MKTIKELEASLIIDKASMEVYIEWYKEAIKSLYNDIRNAETISVYSIEKWLYNLIKEKWQKHKEK
jgi:hypothetical protein